MSHGSLDLLVVELHGEPSRLVTYGHYQELTEIQVAIKRLRHIHSCEAHARLRQGAQIIRVRIDPEKRQSAAGIRSEVLRILNGFAIDPRFFGNNAQVKVV